MEKEILLNTSISSKSGVIVERDEGTRYDYDEQIRLNKEMRKLRKMLKNPTITTEQIILAFGSVTVRQMQAVVGRHTMPVEIVAMEMGVKNETVNSFVKRAVHSVAVENLKSKKK